MSSLEIQVVGFAGSLADALHVANFRRGDDDFDHDVPFAPSGWMNENDADQLEKAYLKRIRNRIVNEKDTAMQNKPEYLDQLIDLASKAAGSDYKLAQRLGVNRQAVSNWRHGHKTCPAADQALMADIAGLEAEAWGNRALIAAYEGTPKGELLKQALKKALAATGAALVSSGIDAAQVTNAAHDMGLYLIRCIFSTPHRVLFQPVR